MAELIRVYPENPATKTIEQAIAVLKADGIVVVPTDTVYSFLGIGNTGSSELCLDG